MKSNSFARVLFCFGLITLTALPGRTQIDPGTVGELEPPIYRFQAPSELKPLPSGPGLVVFPPSLPKGSDQTLQDMTATAARWLQLHAAGQLAFGKSTSWLLPEATSRLLGYKDLRAGAPQAIAVANSFGATHIAIGTLSGSGERLKLAYQVGALTAAGKKKVATWKSLGAPISLAGNRDALAAGLPGLATSMVKRLGGGEKVTAAPLSASDLALLGKAYRSKRKQIAGAELKRVDELILKDPLAGGLALDSAWMRHRFPTARIAEGMAASGGDNPLVWSLIGRGNLPDYQPYVERVVRLAKAHPNNAALALAENQALESVAGLYRRSEVAERLVRCNPKNAYNWLLLDAMMTYSAQFVRVGRTSDRVTEKEWEALAKTYRLATEVSQRAAALAPHDGETWRSLAGSATFSGDAKLARGAFWKAHQLMPNSSSVYVWGFEMFQDKWGGTDAELEKIVKLAVNAKFPTALDRRHISRILKRIGRDEESFKIADLAIAQARREIEEDPDNADARYSLAMSFHERNDHFRAIPEMRESLRIQPDRVDRRSELAEMLLQDHNYQDAIPEFERILKQIPGSFTGVFGKGRALHWMGRHAEAEPMLRKCYEAQPYSGLVMHFLGGTLFSLNRHAEALPFLKESAQRTQWISGNHLLLAHIYMQKGEWVNAEIQSKLGIEVAPKVPDMHWALGKARLQLGNAQEALTSAREARRLNAEHPAFPLLEGEALQKLGKTSEAIAAWEAVLKIDAGRDGQEAKWARDLIAKARETK